MKFEPTGIEGAFVVHVEARDDERGFFARAYCADEFRANGIELPIAQCSISFNRIAGTLRGLHYQAKPHEETKLVRCTRGAIFDVVLDVRRGSTTYLQWRSIELSGDNRRMLVVPPGCAHGFQSLVDACEVFYQISVPYQPESARGLRWDDPAFAIPWPIKTPLLSQADRSHPLLHPQPQDREESP